MRFAGGGPEATQPGHHRPSLGGEDVAGSSDGVVAVGVATEGVGEGAAEVALAVEAVGPERRRLQLAVEGRKATTAIPLGMSRAEMPCHAAGHTLASAPAGGAGGWAAGDGGAAPGSVSAAEGWLAGAADTVAGVRAGATGEGRRTL